MPPIARLVTPKDAATGLLGGGNASRKIADPFSATRRTVRQFMAPCHDMDGATQDILMTDSGIA
jgi:glutamate dehydrogenase/leucine dehydrogenase